MYVKLLAQVLVI